MHQDDILMQYDTLHCITNYQCSLYAQIQIQFSMKKFNTHVSIHLLFIVTNTLLRYKMLNVGISYHWRRFLHCTSVLLMIHFDWLCWSSCNSRGTIASTTNSLVILWRSCNIWNVSRYIVPSLISSLVIALQYIWYKKPLTFLKSQTAPNCQVGEGQGFHLMHSCMLLVRLDQWERRRGSGCGE